MINTTQLKQALPIHLRNNVDQDLVDMINGLSQGDPVMAEDIRNNIISYTSVMREGKYKLSDYVNAVTYVTYKLLGHTNIEAYTKTFPDRYATLLANGADSRRVSSMVHAYSKGKLVNAIIEQSLVPVWIVNHEVYQQAINTQADLMMNARSEMVRTTAANSILTHLQKPKEAANVSLNIDMRDTSGMKELQDTLRQMATQQKQLIIDGTGTKEITESDLVVEYENS